MKHYLGLDAGGTKTFCLVGDETGLVKGFGLKAGAFACSAAWDCSAIIVAGAGDSDMAMAVNRIRSMQGGEDKVVANTVARNSTPPARAPASAPAGATPEAGSRSSR